MDLVTVNEEGIMKYHRMQNSDPIKWCEYSEERREKWSQEGADEAVRRATGNPNARSGDAPSPDRSQVLRYLRDAVERQKSGELVVRKVRYPRLISEVWQRFSDGDVGHEEPESVLKGLEEENEEELKAWKSMLTTMKDRS